MRFIHGGHNLPHVASAFHNLKESRESAFAMTSNVGIRSTDRNQLSTVSEAAQWLTLNLKDQRASSLAEAPLIMKPTTESLQAQGHPDIPSGAARISTNWNVRLSPSHDGTSFMTTEVGTSFTATEANTSFTTTNTSFTTTNTSFTTTNTSFTTNEADLSFTTTQARASTSFNTLVKQLVQTKIPSLLSSVNFELQVELQYRLQENLIPIEELIKTVQKFSEPYLEQKTEAVVKRFLGMNRLLKLDDQTSTLKAELRWSDSTDSQFEMKILVPTKLKTSALQRKFGSKQVFQLTLPPMKNRPDNLSWTDAKKAMKRLLSAPLLFFGRKWSTYDLQPNKVTKKSSNKSGLVGGSTLFLFAWNQNTTIVDAMKWALPYEKNKTQSSRKAFSRLGLQLSRTDVAVVFEASDIEYDVEDQRANGEAESKEFTDSEWVFKHGQSYEGSPQEPSAAPRVMNDGCSTMSMWTAVQYQHLMDLDAPPVALQARIAGSKGVWFLEHENPKCLGSKPVGTHIRISTSQKKVQYGDLKACDASIRALNVARHNEFPKPTFLSISFILILVDRGVLKADIIRIIKDQVRMTTRRYLDAIQSPDTLSLRAWLSSEQGRREEIRRDTEIPAIAGFPLSREEMVVRMLESGFDHRSSVFLAHCVRIVSRSVFDLRGSNFKIKLPRATTLMGIADDKGILAPGEIQVHFSAAFNDAAGDPWMILKDVDALVARNPALAPWDVQKVRIVFRPELAHLRDVVVFSSRGERPLAEKLSGGDYDGDMFWVCWHPELVEPFRNAPAPLHPPVPEKFGINKDKTKLSDHVTDPESEAQWCKWIGDTAWVRLEGTLLGTMTNLHERVTYADQKIDTDRALALVFLHDHLVDADKQGYIFTNDSFAQFMEDYNIPRKLPNPRYWVFTKSEGSEDSHDERSSQHIVDEIYFDIIEPEISSALAAADKSLHPADEDPDLTKFYEQQSELLPYGSGIRDEMYAMLRKLSKIQDSWRERNSQDKPRDELPPWNQFIESLRAQYDAIQIEQQEDITTSSWAYGWVTKQGDDLSLWDKLKASAFAYVQSQKGSQGESRLLFYVAGYEMCVLKAHENRNNKLVRAIVEEQYCALKVRKRKRKRRREDSDDEEPNDEEL